MNETHEDRTSLKKQPTAFFLARIIFKKFQTKKERTLITLIASTLRESIVVEKSNARFFLVVPLRRYRPKPRAREHFFVSTRFPVFFWIAVNRERGKGI